MLPHVVSDTVMLVAMEIAAVLCLRVAVLELFGIDLFDLKSGTGKVTAAAITTLTFVGIYRVMTTKGAMLKLGRGAIIIYLIGKRGSGKSTLMEDILSHIAPRLDMGLAMTPTEDSAAMFRKHFPEAWIFDGYAENTIEELIDVQKNAARDKKQRSLALVLDDCMYQRNVLRSNAQRNLHFNGRHLHLTFINAVQYLMDIEPSMRANVDYVFAMRETIHSNKMKLWKFFFGVFPSYQDFSRTMDACTKDYSAIVLDCTQAGASSIEEQIFWYKADVNVRPFRIGKQIFWKLARRYTRTNEEMRRARRDLADAQACERKSNAAGQRITLVQRKDAQGRTLLEDRRSTHVVEV